MELLTAFIEAVYMLLGAMAEAVAGIFVPCAIMVCFFFRPVLTLAAVFLWLLAYLHYTGAV